MGGLASRQRAVGLVEGRRGQRECAGRATAGWVEAAVAQPVHSSNSQLKITVRACERNAPLANAAQA